MKKIIVTGATGMIGASMIEQMIADGMQVTAVVRPNTQKSVNLVKSDRINVVECDIRSLKDLVSKLNDKYDAFYHFAWDGTYGESRNDVALQEVNIRVAIEAVDVAHALGCRIFIGAGSQAELGNVEGDISDALPKNPTTAYGIAKLTACRMSRIRCEKYGIRHSWGRIISTYGPRDNSYTMVMSSIIGMYNNERLSFTKGEQTWDYIYGKDCSRAFYLIGKSGKHGKSYTIGSGKARKLSAYITDIKDVVNPNLKIGIGELDYYENQVMHLCADITELQEDTGFTPTVDFKDGIKETLKWYIETRMNEST